MPTRQTWLVSLAVAVSLPALVSCGPQSLEDPSVQSQTLIHGEASGPEDDGVMMIWSTTSTAIGKCTASLIAPTLVVTALHCVANFTDAPFGCTASGDLTPGSAGGQLGATVDPTILSVRAGVGPDLTVVAKGLQIFAAQTSSTCRNDIAVVLLDRAVENVPIVPMRLLTGTNPGEQTRLIGYGRDEDGGFGVRRSRPGLVIAQVGSSQFRPTGDPVPPRTLVTVGPAGCNGDSGGPLLSAHEAIVGVFSQVTGDCEDPSARDFSTEVAPFYDDVIAPAFAAAHFDPILEDASNSAGAGGASDAPDAATDPADAAAAATPDAATDDGAAAGASGYAGLRKAGGCTCGVAGPAGGSGLSPVLVLPLFLLSLRRRQQPRAS